MDEKTIYAKWLATKLIRAGFPVVRIEKNPSNPRLNCWVFAATPEFELAFVNLANLPH